MRDELINQLAMQLAQLRSRVETLESAQEEAREDAAASSLLRMESDGGAGDAAADMGPFAVRDGKITNRRYMVAREMYVMYGDDPDASDGTWFLVVQHSNNTAQLVNYSLSPSTDVSTSDTQTSIPIYKIQDGEISEDFRGMPLVMIRE